VLFSRLFFGILKDCTVNLHSGIINAINGEFVDYELPTDGSHSTMQV
jgi:hypothetical protein